MKKRRMKLVFIFLFMVLFLKGYSQLDWGRDDLLSRARAKSIINDLVVDREYDTLTDSISVTILIDIEEKEHLEKFHLEDLQYNTPYNWELYDFWGKNLWDQAEISLLEIRAEEIRTYNNKKMKVLKFVFVRL